MWAPLPCTTLRKTARQSSPDSELLATGSDNEIWNGKIATTTNLSTNNLIFIRAE